MNATAPLIEASVRADVLAQNFVTVTGKPDGPTIVFAHGFGCDQDMWRHLLPSFARDHRIVLFDHVGAGRSDLASYDPVRHTELDGYVDDLLQVCDSLGLRDVVLVAPSPCYIDDPDDGYVGGFSRADIDELLASLDHNYYAWAAAMAPVVMGPDAPALGQELADSFCRTDPDIAREFARVTFLTDSRPLLPLLRTPALILQCTDDALAPPEVGRYLHRRLEGSTLVELAATGHCPHVSAPQETSEAIRSFLTAAR